MTKHDIIDEKVIAELKNIMGDEYTTVYDAFLRTGDTHIAELTAAVDKINIEDVEKISHTLKGSSANIGANNLSEICKLLLDQSRCADTTGFPELSKKINDEYRHVKNAIKVMLESK